MPKISKSAQQAWLEHVQAADQDRAERDAMDAEELSSLGTGGWDEYMDRLWGTEGVGVPNDSDRSRRGETDDECLERLKRESDETWDKFVWGE